MWTLPENASQEREEAAAAALRIDCSSRNDLLNERSLSIMRGELRGGKRMRVERAAVLGAGTMGAQIAAHLANAGVPTLLLDISPRDLTPEEQAKGLKLDSAQVKNRIARGGLEAAVKAKPAAFFVPEFASLVTPGNFDDDLSKVKDCDLIIEAVVENL